MDELKEMQENLFEYFEGISTNQLVQIIDGVIYFQPTDDKKISQLRLKFLQDMDVEDIYLNYYQDITNPKHFMRTSMSERGLWENLTRSLLSIAFNRLRTLI